MGSQQVYLQAPIKKELRQIRILTLAPGIYSDTLQGSFEVENLDYDDIHYTAFSYTWSGPIGERTIQIGQAPLKITKNLAAALRHFRGPVRPKKIWVDAICINQSDDEEKGFQVALMGDIYRNASRTWIWLGEESDDSDTAIEYIVSFRDLLSVPKLNYLKIHHPNPREVPWRAIFHLLERPWWRRIWVVQEVLKSPRSILQCGKKGVDLELFIQFATSVPETYKEAQTLSQHPFFGILDQWYDHKRIISSCGFSLESLLDLTCGFQVSVRRDKIFALLGMVHQEVRSWIIPNYAISDRLFHIRLTIYLLRTSLEPLLAVNYSRATDCPSWVPDWTNIDRSVLKKVLAEARAAKFPPSPLDSGRPGAGRQPQRTDLSIEELTEYQEPTALLVHGWVKDRVKASVQMPKLADFPDDGPMSARIQKWESCVTECLQNTRVPCTRISAGERTYHPSASQKRILGHLLFLNAQVDEFPDGLTLAFAWYQFLIHTTYGFGKEWIDMIESYREHIQEHQREGITARGLELDRLNVTRNGALHWMEYSPKARPGGHPNDANSLHTTRFMLDTSLKSDVSQFWVLTDKGHLLQGNGKMIAQEGDIVCQPHDSLECLVLRKAGEKYWTLVGQFHWRASWTEQGRDNEMQLFRLI